MTQYSGVAIALNIFRQNGQVFITIAQIFISNDIDKNLAFIK
ncbi:MAG: hypothetical protein V7K35_05535 [Nostoc sp.]